MLTGNRARKASLYGRLLNDPHIQTFFNIRIVLVDTELLLFKVGYHAFIYPNHKLYTNLQMPCL